MRNVAKKVTLSLLSALALTACGGGESGQNTKQPNPEQPSSNLTTSTLEGTAADNIIRHGEVRIYSWDGQEKEILFSTQTDEQGHYQATLETDSTFLKACVISGEYTEEASQITISLTEGDRLCAIAPRKQGVQHLMVTPETHLATALIEYQINSGNNDLANVVTHANNSIGSLFGYDILTTKPADLTSADIIDAQLNDSLRSGLWHAAFSSLALAAAEQNGLTTHNSLNSSLALHKAFYQDLSSDGKLDGQVLTSNGETLALGLDNFVLSANVFRTKLAEHLIRYVASTQNKTAIQVPDIINNAERLSQNISHLFHDNDHPMALDTDAPQVQFDIEENSYIQGQFQLGVTITDFTGIKQASYYLNDGQEINFDVSQPHLQIDTTQIADGELIIHFTAIDFLNNKAELNLVLQVANERPSLQLTSNKITNQSQYHFVAKVEKTTHALTSLKVNGKNADYENHELSATLNLQPGANTVNVTLLNEIGHEYHYSFAVMLDSVTPTIEAVDLSWVYREKDTSTYITPAFYRLNGLLVNQANLAAKQWPTLALNISDSDINGSYASSSNKLTASLSYFSDGATQASFTRSLNIPSDSLLWIPFSEEYLGEKWYEKNGEKRLVIQVNDEAGNSNQKEYTYHTLLSAPVVNPELSTHVQGDFDLVMHTQELEGIDQVIVQLDGEMLTWDWKNSATLPLNTTQLSDGKHRLTIQAIAGEETLYSKEVEFNVDNTAPVIHIDSPTLVSDDHYNLTGTVVEEGGLANLTATLNEHHYKLLQNTRIEQAMTLESGDNLIAVSAQDLAGNKSSAQQRVIFDSVNPCFQCMISDLGQQSIGQLDLYYLDFNVRHGISHDPDLSPMLLQKPIYLDGSVNSLHGLELNTETDLTVLQGKNYGMAHFRFNVSDSQSEGAVVTDATQLKTYLTVKFNDDTVVAEQLLTPLNPNNTQALHYLVPITQEFFSNGLIDLQPNDTVTAQFTVQDLAGRSTSKTYLFSVFNAPSSIQNPEIEGAIKSVSGTLNLNVTVKAEAGLSRISVSKTGHGNIFDWNSKEQTTLIKSLELPQQNATTDGMHSWTVSVTDLAGVTKTQTYSAEIDNTLPTLSGSGFNSNLTNGDLSFSLTAQDNKGLASIKIFNATNNSLLYSYTPNGQTSYAIAPPKQTTTGVHNWKVEVTDLAGNTYSRAYSAEIDKTLPTLSGSGFNSSLTKGDLSFALTAQDNKGLASIKILNATNNSLLYSYTPNGQTSYAIAPPKQTTTGVHNWKVEVTDLAGNTYSRAYSAEIDKTLPTLSGSGFNSSLTKGDLSFALTAQDNKGLASIKILNATNNSLLYSYTPNGQTSYAIAPPKQTTTGVHNWKVEVTDLAGNTYSRAYSAEIDKTLPTLSGSGFNSSLTKGDLSFALTAQDNKGLASIKILNATNNSLLYSYTPNGQTSYAIAPPKQTTTGVHNWKVEVTDLAGNTFSKTYGAEIDKVAPTINVGSIPTATVGTPLTISGSVYDANLSSFVISVDLPGSPIKTMSYSSSGTFSNDFYLSGNEGPVTITFTAKDKLGQTTTITKTTTYNKPFGWTNIDTDRSCVGIPGNCASISTNTITYNRDIASVRLESPKMSCFSPVNETHTARVVTITSRIAVGGSGCPSNEILLNVYVTAKNGEVSTLSMRANRF